MIKKILKRLGQLLLLAVMLTGGYLGFNYRHTAAFPRIISAFYSKEFCSC